MKTNDNKLILIMLSGPLMVTIAILCLSPDASAELRDRVVLRQLVSTPILTADPTTASQGSSIDSYSRVSLLCRDDVSGRIASGETAVFELWFYHQVDSLWHMNDGDTITVDETHDHYSFEMNGYDRMVVRKVSGNTFVCALLVD